MSVSMRLNCFYILFFMFYVNHSVVHCADLITTSTQIDIQTKIANEIELIKLKCENHQNCSSKLFTLDSYCCPASGYCCNWFEFVSNFQTANTSNLPYKAPTLLTIFTLLIMIVCILFISYCFSILFCYCFKCGLFKKPNLIVITELSNNSTDSTSAEMISPKYSSNTSSSTASFSSTNESPFNQASYRHRSKNNKSSSSQLNKQKSKKLRHNQSYPANVSSSNHSSNPTGNSSSTRRNVRSPTARASSSGASSRTYAKTDCYIDYDNESPFLIPQQVNQKNHSKASSNRRTNQYRSYRQPSSNHQVSAPLRSNSVLNHRPTSVRSSSTTATALLENELTNERNNINNNQLETLVQTPSSSAATSRASSSLDFGASLMEAVETAAADNGINLSVKPSAPNYYLDEKPPSYDDIIGVRK